MTVSTTSSMQATPTLCSTGVLLSVLNNEENMTILFIVLIAISLILCCVSSVMCVTVCVLCHRRRSRTGDMQDSTNKSNGYMMPVLNEEKETQSNDLAEPSMGTFGQNNNIITNEDVVNDRLRHNSQQQQQHEEDTMVIIHTLVPQVGPMTTPMINNDRTQREQPMTMIDEDTNNPLYMKHRNNTIPADDDSSNDSDHDYLDVLLPEEAPPTNTEIRENTTGTTGTTGTPTGTTDHGEGDYENYSSIKLNEVLNRQMKPRSTTTPISPTVPKPPSRTPSNASKHDHMITQTTSSSNGSRPTTTSTSSSNNVPPETKPKPKNKQRKPSNASSHNEPTVFSPTANHMEEEPHYVKPRPSADSIPAWQFYKELDFSTVDPSNDYVVPYRDSGY